MDVSYKDYWWIQIQCMIFPVLQEGQRELDTVAVQAAQEEAQPMTCEVVCFLLSIHVHNMIW